MQAKKRRETMSQLKITNLNFLDTAFPNQRGIEGGGNITPDISTDAATDLDTKLEIEGNLQSGFKLIGSAAG
ncbi:MAG: hypothetical protein BRC57_16035, partial [Cyanobacteria bacterium QS_8_48_54]